MIWHPIETAPKDGEPFIAWHRDWGVPLSIRWSEHWEEWVLNGAMIKLGDWGDPSYWQPLPEPPAGEQVDRIGEQGRTA